MSIARYKKESSAIEVETGSDRTYVDGEAGAERRHGCAVAFRVPPRDVELGTRSHVGALAARALGFVRVRGHAAAALHLACHLRLVGAAGLCGFD